MKSVFRSPRVWFSCVCAALLALSAGSGRADAPRQMSATAPFVLAKTIDSAGHVTRRVGGIFAASNDPGVRLSFTIICEPKQPAATLSLLVVQQGATVPASADPKPVALSVDGQQKQSIAAQRIVQGNIAGYVVSDAEPARTAVAALRKG